MIQKKIFVIVVCLMASSMFFAHQNKSNQTTFPGRIEALSVFDVMAGYNFNSGLKIHVSVVNALNNKFRALPGMPQIGRTATLGCCMIFNFN